MSLFTRLIAEPEPLHHLISPNPRLGSIRFSRAISLLLTAFFFLIFLLLIIFSLVNDIVTSGAGPFPWYFLFPLLVFFSNVGVYSLQIHYWNRIEPWRFAAALGEKRLLADAQPQPNTEALQVPVTIRI